MVWHTSKSVSMSTRKSKAERVQAAQSIHSANEHECDLFSNAIPVNTTILDAAEKKVEPLSILTCSTLGSSLLPGMVLLKKFIHPFEQQQLVHDARELGLGTGGFYKPQYASGAKCRLHQMCVGRHWNVQTEQYEHIRTNHDNASVPPLPQNWTSLASKCLHAAIMADPQVLGTCSSMVPDVCVVNYYKKAGRNGMHIDKDESIEAMEMGSPVISISIGATASFAFSKHYPAPDERVPHISLESGDVLVFGGPSRRLVHALSRVFPHTEPEWLYMRPGRLNFTFREYQPE